MEKIKTIIIGLGFIGCLYAFVLLASLIGAVVYDNVNGGHEAFHWLYTMQCQLS